MILTYILFINDAGTSLLVKTPYFLLNLTRFQVFTAPSDKYQQIRARNLKEKLFSRDLSTLERPTPHPPAPPRRPYVANLCQAVKH